MSGIAARRWRAAGSSSKCAMRKARASLHPAEGRCLRYHSTGGLRRRVLERSLNQSRSVRHSCPSRGADQNVEGTFALNTSNATAAPECRGRSLVAIARSTIWQPVNRRKVDPSSPCNVELPSGQDESDHRGCAGRRSLSLASDAFTTSAAGRHCNDGASSR